MKLNIIFKKCDCVSGPGRKWLLVTPEMLCCVNTHAPPPPVHKLYVQIIIYFFLTILKWTLPKAIYNNPRWSSYKRSVVMH